MSRVKLTEEDRKRLALKKKEQASKLSWNDGDGEGVGMRIVVLKHVFHPDDARAAYNFYEEVARIIRNFRVVYPFSMSSGQSLPPLLLLAADDILSFAAARGDRRYHG